MNRRDFLNIPLDASAPEPVKRNLPIVSKREAGYSRDYARHSFVLIEEAHAWLGRDSLGFYAIDASCSHLGCMVVPDGETFVCPCHQSIFTREGMVIQGPAWFSLRFLMVDLNEEGKLIIHRNQFVSPDERFIA